MAQIPYEESVTTTFRTKAKIRRKGKIKAKVGVRTLEDGSKHSERGGRQIKNAGSDYKKLEEGTYHSLT